MLVCKSTFRICLVLAAATFAKVSPLPAQGQLWAGQPVHEEGWTFGAERFLGWIWVGEETGSGWIYSLAVGDYLYLPENHLSLWGGWAYFPSLAKAGLLDGGSADGWYYATPLKTWTYSPEAVSGAERGWAFILNTGTEASRLADRISINTGHTENPEATPPGERYANAFHLDATDILMLSDADPDIVVSQAPGGVTFTSTAFRGNSYIRIGYREDIGGLLDFNALENLSGTGWAVVRADVGLGNTTNGFYVRMKNATEDVGTSERIPGGANEEDRLLHSYLTNPEEGAFVEVTLPWQGSVTVRGVYLHMQDEVHGFADMDARITGGAGATEAHTWRVSTATELKTAIDAVSGLGEPAIIEIAGTITYADWVAASGSEARQITLGESYQDLSLVGIGDQAVFDGVGFELHGSNIVFHNLTIRYVLARDAITINNATYVRIDHCTLHNEPMEINTDKDKYDELIGIKNAAQHVILSWNHLYNSHKTILVGSNDAVDAIPDRRLIMHHNWLQDCGSRLPLYRGGYAHIYNNYFERVDSAVNVRTNSQILIENNYFKDCGGAIGYWFDTSNPAGRWEVHGNIYDNVGGNKPTTSTTDIRFAGDYTYTLHPASEVPQMVMTSAGAGR